MTDKERILMTIIRQLAVTQSLGPQGRCWGEEAYTSDSLGTLVHFAPWLSSDFGGGELRPGMLVLCKSSPISEWTVAFIVESHGGGECLLREIGSDRLCTMSNESFTPIVGLRGSDLWEGDQHKFAAKVRMAFQKGEEYLYRFGGVDFNKDDIHQATIWVREVFGGLNPSKPFAVPIKWNNRMSVKKILETMRAGGYGTREFEIDEVKLARLQQEDEKRAAQKQ